MAGKNRGDNAVRQTASVPRDSRWGTLDPDEWAGRVTLMSHPTYGELFFPNDEVENRTARGWVAVEYTDPTRPVTLAAQEPGAVIGSKPPTEREDVAEAKPKPAPKKRSYRSKK